MNITNYQSSRVRSLDIVLQDVEVGVSDQELEENHRRNLGKTLKSCEHVLLDAEKLIMKYKLLEVKQPHVCHKAIRTLRKFTWDPAEISNLRDRIVSNVTLLDTFLTFLSGYYGLSTSSNLELPGLLTIAIVKAS